MTDGESAKMIASKIPQELRSLKQWVLWKMGRRGENLSKIPCQINGKLASSTDPQTWTSFEEAESNSAGYSGIGFVFSESDPYCGIDFDNCRRPDTGEVARWAKDWIKKLDSYAEVSPSKTGVKVWVKAKWPMDSGKKVFVPEPEIITGKKQAVEVYDHARYFAATGLRLKGMREEPQERQAVVDELCKTHWPESAAPIIAASTSSVMERTRKYMATMDDAISGSGGHNQTYKVTCRLMHGFDLSKADMRILLGEYNQRCKPKWTDKELNHKIDSADKEPGIRGYLRDAKDADWSRVVIPEYVDPSGESRDAPTWPVLADAAYCGLAGEIVREIEPYTEADPVSVLLHLLAGFGNLTGPEPHFRIANAKHPARLSVAIVGDSSKSRKGTTWGPLRETFRRIDPEYVDRRVRSGLSTGEGLIYHIRDAKGTDNGEGDKRLLCIEEEFSSMLVLMSREGNSLSGMIRQAWDSGNLATLTRKDPLTTTGAHVSIIGHTTRDELLRHLSRTEQANGFANRFIWALARRSKLLPDGASVPDETLDSLAGQLKAAVEFARKVLTMRRDATANALWGKIYGDLSDGRPGLLGAMLNRAETQVVRLSLTYALMDSSLVVTVDHLKAALAVWDYCEASVRFIFGEATGNPDADRILDALRQSPDNRMTDEAIQRDVFKNHGGHRKTAALTELERLGRVRQEKGEGSGGRVPMVWALAS